MQKLALALVVALPLALAAVRVPVVTKDLIYEVNAKQSSWVAGVNTRFWNVTYDEIKHLFGVREDSYRKWLELPQRENAPENFVAPESFDAREAWTDCPTIREIRDQANCGSCWAFGAVEAMSDRHCIFSNGTVTPHLSAQDMVSCCTSCGFGCNGGYPSAAWQYWVSQGVVTGGNYGDKNGCQAYVLKPCDHHVDGKYGPCPDTVPTPACKKQCDDGVTPWQSAKYYGARAYSVSGIANIQNEIMKNGPVEAAFSVYSDFLTYKSGVYKHTSGSYLGGHAVKIIGWGKEGNDNYWLVANSWNEDWGDKGFFKIAFGQCGIESQIVAGTPRL